MYNMEFIWMRAMYRMCDYIYVCSHVTGYLQITALLANCPSVYVLSML